MARSRGSSLTYGALLGAFLLALVALVARQPHAIAGMAAGMLAMRSSSSPTTSASTLSPEAPGPGTS
jgi:hypothetical protein